MLKLPDGRASRYRKDDLGLANPAETAQHRAGAREKGTGKLFHGFAANTAHPTKDATVSLPDEARKKFRSVECTFRRKQKPQRRCSTGVLPHLVVVVFLVFGRLLLLPGSRDVE